MIKMINITKIYTKNKEKKIILDNVNLHLKKGETLAIMGASGSGKTTLSRIILRLINEDGGDMFYQGKNIKEFSKGELLNFRKDVQLVSQHPEAFFDPSMQIIKSLIEPLKNFKCYDKKEFEKRVKELLEELKLKEALLQRYPHQLSGGEIQRLSIIRSLLLRPKILILDECTSMLDISVQAQILHLLKKLKEKEKLTYCFISHDLNVVEFMADRILEIKNGKLNLLR